MTTDPPGRRFASCICGHCRAPYLLILQPGQAVQGSGYCSAAHQKKAYAARRALTCPVGCGRPIKKPGAVVCGQCWNVAAGMCLGKRRLQEASAKIVQCRRDILAYWCRCCGWWHNGHPVLDGDGLVEEVGRVLEGMRKAKGQVWVNELIEGWDPEVRDRVAWSAGRLSDQRRGVRD